VDFDSSFFTVYVPVAW